jgi:hypothetical protein
MYDRYTLEFLRVSRVAGGSLAFEPYDSVAATVDDATSPAPIPASLAGPDAGLIAAAAHPALGF